MAIFDMTGRVLSALSNDPLARVLISSHVPDFLSSVAEFHINRGARNAEALKQELEGF